MSKPAVIVRPDGREIINPATPEGYAEYKWRVMLFWLRQRGWCCFRDYDFCPGRLKLSEATMEHENKRGAGKHDSRIAIFDEEGLFIRHINGAAHLACNSIVGSRRLPLFYGDNASFQIPKTVEANV